MAAAKRVRTRVKVEKGIYREKTAAGVDRYIVYLYPGAQTVCLGSYDTLVQARRERKKAEGTAATKGVAALALAGKRLTVAAFIRDWQHRRDTDPDKKIRPATRRSTDAVLARYIVPVLGGYLVSQVTVSILERAYRKIVSGGRRGQFRGKQGAVVIRGGAMSPKYRRNILQLLRQLTADMHRLGYLADDPGPRVEGPEVPRPQPRVYAVAMMTQAIARMREPHRSAAILTILTGIRQGELLALTWPDVDLERKRIHVSKSRDQLTGELGEPKTQAGNRFVPISDETVAFLKDYRARQLAGIETKPRNLGPYDGPLLFPAMRRRTSKYAGRIASIDPSRLRAAFARAARTVIPVGTLPTWHGIRHVFASLAIAKSGKAALAFISVCLGHADVSTTLRIYTHLLPGEESEHVEAVSGAVWGSEALRGTLPIPDPIPEPESEAEPAGNNRVGVEVTMGP
jgi:integrase